MALPVKHPISVKVPQLHEALVAAFPKASRGIAPPNGAPEAVSERNSEAFVKSHGLCYGFVELLS